LDLIRDVYSEAWALYKTHWRHLLTLAFVVYVAVAVIGTLLVAVLTWLGWLIAALISLIALFWLQAALVKAVEDVRDGRADLSLSQTFEAGRAHLAAVVAAGFIAVVGVGIGLFLLIVPGLVLTAFWAVIVPAIVIEGRSAGESFGRSFELTRARFWEVLGVVVPLVLVLFGLPIVLDRVLSPVADWLQSFVSQIVSGTLTAPLFALVLTVLYFRLRAAHEHVAAAASAEEPPAETPTNEPPPATSA
jgi:hypothetical protein